MQTVQLAKNQKERPRGLLLKAFTFIIIVSSRQCNTASSQPTTEFW